MMRLRPNPISHIGLGLYVWGDSLYACPLQMNGRPFRLKGLSSHL
uniref:Uncharacterized protein n=1 Tax=uncultured prokaryote TaxID=198431 RepID=A0A0H5Q384_9ZZZZ|nr:hypothetical protein [uncultured prokaryote]